MVKTHHAYYPGGVVVCRPQKLPGRGYTVYLLSTDNIAKKKEKIKKSTYLQTQTQRIDRKYRAASCSCPQESAGQCKQ
jgi:hypothetical protein